MARSCIPPRWLIFRAAIGAIEAAYYASCGCFSYISLTIARQVVYYGKEALVVTYYGNTFCLLFSLIRFGVLGIDYIAIFPGVFFPYGLRIVRFRLGRANLDTNRVLTVINVSSFPIPDGRREQHYCPLFDYTVNNCRVAYAVTRDRG